MIMPLFVSVIIPARNEERYIKKCLDSILAQDYPAEHMEILVADGMSTDQTREVLIHYSAAHHRIRWFINPKKIVPTALNILIRQARGEVIVRMDAHAEYANDYISRCVYHLEKNKVDN